MCTTLVCVLFVATPTITLVCVLFVATPMSTISVYYFSMCTACHRSTRVLFVATTIHVYDNSVSVYSILLLLFIVNCTSQLPIHVLYNSVSVYYLS